jgi:hypothetical protein
MGERLWWGLAERSLGCLEQGRGWRSKPHGPGMGILRLSAVAGLAVVGSLALRLRLGSG